MPRDSGGTYTLPAGNPVVSGTVISSTWANDTMADVRATLTDSLSRSGNGGMQAPFKSVDGSAGSPAITFNNDTNTGLFRKGTDNTGLAAGGSEVAEWDDEGLKTTLTPASNTCLVNKQYVVSSAPSRANYLINGGFEFWQRGSLFTSTTGAQYGPDRWRMESLTSTELRPHPGFDFNLFSGEQLLRVGFLNSAGSVILRQPLEYGDARLLHGKQVTASAQFAGVTGNNFILQIQYSNTAGGAGPWVNLADSTVLTSAASPQTLSATGTIPNTALAVSIVIRNTASATVAGDVFVWAAQLVEGDLVQPWQRAGTTYAGELALCQRFYEKSYDLATAPGTATGPGAHAYRYFVGGAIGNGPKFSVKKRDTPTCTAYSPNNGAADSMYNASTTTTFVISGIFDPGENGFEFGIPAQSANEYITYHWTAEAEL